MAAYFDAFRIDHILGFFRIWSIPMYSLDGVMGHFELSIPLHISEFRQKDIFFDYHRYIHPFINEAVIWEVFASESEFIKSSFLTHLGEGFYDLKEFVNEQRKVERHFAGLEANDYNSQIRNGLLDLIANVILFEEPGSFGMSFHFRIGMETTSSFRYLDWQTQQHLKELYVNYFFRRQDHFWQEEAMKKLPRLKQSTNMLVCGEDLGMVPACVPDVMKQLGILSLEIQRMPKSPKQEFFHPAPVPK